MRTPDVMRLTLDAAETGHLVLATMHSSTCAEAISRICLSFPAEIQSSIMVQLADCLNGVVCQRLTYLPYHQLRVPDIKAVQAASAGSPNLAQAVRDLAAAARRNHLAISKADPLTLVLMKKLVANRPIGRFVLAPVWMELGRDFRRQLVGNAFHGAPQMAATDILRSDRRLFHLGQCRMIKELTWAFRAAVAALRRVERADRSSAATRGTKSFQARKPPRGCLRDLSRQPSRARRECPNKQPRVGWQSPMLLDRR